MGVCFENEMRLGSLVILAFMLQSVNTDVLFVQLVVTLSRFAAFDPNWLHKSCTYVYVFVWKMFYD